MLIVMHFNATREQIAVVQAEVLNMGLRALPIPGIRTFERATRNTLDLPAVPLVRELSHLPIIVDPSHAAGKRSRVPAMSKAAQW